MGLFLLSFLRIRAFAVGGEISLLHELFFAFHDLLGGEDYTGEAMIWATPADNGSNDQI